MNLPSPCKLPGRNKSTPFVFVAGDAFPFSCNIMKPYAGPQEKGSMKRIFNYRLSRARRVSENTFGIIASVFRILRKPILLEPKTAKKVILAIVYLHNFLRKSESKTIYNPNGFDMNEPQQTGSGEGLNNIPRIPRRSANDVQAVRNEFAEYFISPQGMISFQYDK